jgi:L-fucose mutarotase
MLIGIDPILSPDALALLRAMGHGDTVVLTDANFPSEANARRLVRLDGAGGEQVLDAVLRLLPIDDFEPDPLVAMQAVGATEGMPDAVAAFQQVVVQRLGASAPRIALVDRHAFYTRARNAFGIIATAERRFYGNLILRKGVIPA